MSYSQLSTWIDSDKMKMATTKEIARVIKVMDGSDGTGIGKCCKSAESFRSLEAKYIELL